MKGLDRNKDNPKVTTKVRKDRKLEIPVNGNLAVLASGYEMIAAWRKIREHAKSANGH